MQFLVQGKDKSLSIIYKKSIVVEKSNSSLAIGERVKFMWPENSQHQKKFSGVIIARDENEEYLIDMKDSIVNSWKKNNPNNKKNKLVKQQSTEKKKERSKPVTILENDIMKEISIKKSENMNMQDQKKEEWIIDEIEYLKNEVTLEIDAIKEKLISKLDFFKSSLSGNKNLNLHTEIKKGTPNKKRDRSFGMPLSFENDDEIVSSKKDENFKDVQEEYALLDKDFAVQEAMLSEESNQINFELDKGRSESYSVINVSSGDSDYGQSNSDNNMIQQMLVNVKKEKKSSDSEDCFYPNSAMDCMINNDIDNRNNNAEFSKKDDLLQVLPSSSKIPQRKRRVNIIYSSEDDDDSIRNFKMKKGFDSNKENQHMNDKVDHEWTLKYHSLDENNVELVKASNVYVNIFDLKKANDAKNQTELARALLLAVYTDEALKVCSLTGQKPKMPNKASFTRPGLDKKGIDAILLYVQHYAKKMSWPPKDKQTILRSLSTKLFELKK